MSVPILISEPEQVWANEIKNYLSSQGFNSEIATSGKECQLKVYKKKYYAVILNVDTQNHSGLEVLTYLRLNAPSLKVILTFKDKKRLQDLGLDLDDLRKLGSSDILIKPFSFDQLQKSIEGANQFESWKNLRPSSEARTEVEIEEVDDAFTRIPIQDFYSGNTTIFDLYVRLAPNRYVKILHQGDFFEDERIQKYACDGAITHLYFKTKERAVYVNFMNQLLQNMVTNKSIPLETKFKAAKNLSEKYIEEIFTNGLRPQMIDEGHAICRNITRMIESDKELCRLLSTYEETSPTAYSHLFLVTFFSTVACKNLDWSSPRTTELIAFGSMLHDLGKLKLPQEIRDMELEDLDERQARLLKQHPKLGTQMLQKCPLITEPVRQIVYQHHEYVDGSGYPNALRGSKIYPLAKIVALSDGFVKHITRLRVSPLVGLREFIPNRIEMMKYDALAVKALVNGFIKNQ